MAEAAHSGSDSFVAIFPSFYSLKLAEFNVWGREFGLIQVEFNASYGIVFRFVSGGLLVFAASNASADKPNIKLFSRLR